jgi:hypothetical protein
MKDKCPKYFMVKDPATFITIEVMSELFKYFSLPKQLGNTQIIYTAGFVKKDPYVLLNGARPPTS